MAQPMTRNYPGPSPAKPDYPNELGWNLRVVAWGMVVISVFAITLALVNEFQL